MKRILAIILCLVLCLTMSPLALADSTNSSTLINDDTGFNYEVIDGKAEINTYTPDESFDGNLVIPETLGGYRVSKLWFLFNELNTLHSVTALHSVSIPDSIEIFYEQCFQDCTILESVEFYAAEDDGSDSDTHALSIPDRAFQGCTSLTSVILSEGIDNIGLYAFKGCTSLTSVILSEGIESIGDRAFQGCTSLTSITIPSSVTEIGVNAFRGCTSLTSITIPSSVTEIGVNAFYGCTSLTGIRFMHDSNDDLVLQQGSYHALSGVTQALTVTVPDADNINPAISEIRWPAGTTFVSAPSDDDTTGSLTDTTELHQNLIIFDGNGETSGNMDHITVNAGDTVTLPVCDFIKTGCVFLNWNTAANGSGTPYAAGERITELPGADGETITLYAQWGVPGNYTLVYHANDGTGAEYSQTWSHNQEKSLASPSFSRTGFTLAGWATDSVSSEATYEPGETVCNVAPIGSSRADIYAVWTPKTYTVKYNANGGTGDMTAETTTCSYGTTYTVPSCGYTRTGYTFTGWARSTYSDAEFVPNGTYSNLTTTANATVWLYAIWSRNAYTVSFDANGGTGSMNETLSMEYGVYAKLPESTFTREGYTFAGWNTRADYSGKNYGNGDNAANITTENGGQVTLYARWTANTYSVVFHSNNTDNSATEQTKLQRITYGKETKLSGNSFTKKGYALAGWAATPNAETAAYLNQAAVINLTAVPNGTVDLYAVWSPITYSITFSANGGTGNMSIGGTLGTGTPNTVTCTYGVDYTLPECEFIRTGYTFAGWSTSPYSASGTMNGESVVDLTSTANARVYLYAIWTRNEYTVSFDANGGTGDMSGNAMTMQYNLSQRLPANIFTKEGYTFKCWNTSPDGKGATYYNSASVTNMTSVNGAAITLYAQWRANGYYVNFHSNENSNISKLQRLTYDVDAKLSCNSFSNTAYLFTGWARTPDAQTADYVNQAVVRNLCAVEAGVIDLYAVWTPVTYTLAFSANGGIGTASLASARLTYGTEYTLPLCPYTRTGYTFAGWATSPYSEAQYSDGSSVSNLSTTSNATVYLYAIWTPNTYTVQFNGNGATSGDMSGSTQTMYYNTYSTLPANTYERTGYTFIGWSVNPGSGTIYQNCSNIANLTSVNAGSVMLYARWQLNTAAASLKASRVTFNGNGATGSMSDTLSLTTGVRSALPANTFVKEGYSFSGWTANAAGTGVVYSDGSGVTRSSASDTASVTLYAKWTPNRYTVVFHSNNGRNLSNRQSFTYGTQATLAGNSYSYNGYNFAGWSVNPSANTATYTNGQKVGNLTSVQNGVVDLYAVWTPRQYKVVFNNNGGTGDMSSANMVCTYGAYYNMPTSNLIRTGYTFAGWTTNLYGGTTYTEREGFSNLTSTANATVTVYAKWTPKNCSIVYNGNGADNPDAMSDMGVTMTYGIYSELAANTYTRVGYTFAGWNTKNDGSGTTYADKALVSGIPVSEGTVTLYAKWTPNHYFVTYHANNGTTQSSIQGMDVGTNTALSANGFGKTGYTFLGWAASETATEAEYTNKQIVTNLTTVDKGYVHLYAVWAPNSYSVVFAANDGTGNTAMSPMLCTYDTEYELNENVFERTGYTFAGWARSSYGAVEFADGAEFTNMTTSANAKVTLYAKWTPNNGTVVFDGHGADNVNAMADDAMSVTYGVYSTLPANEFTRTGYTFTGWNTRPDNLGSNYSNCGTICSIPTENGATVTMYAKWTANLYSVTFHGNNGTNLTTVQNIYYGSTATLNGNGFTRAGYDFLGWARTPNADTAEFANREQVTNLTSEQGGKIDLYAVWTPRHYTVGFNANGGSGSMTNVLSCNYDESATLPACAYTRSGYTFAGWATSAYGSVRLSDEASFTNLTATNGARVTLYARWTANA